MLKLRNVEDKVELELAVEGYQFPDSPQDDWCMVKAVVRQGDELYEAVDPALETTEIVGILEWFKCLSEHRLPRFGHLTFTEPCIEFEFLACEDELVRISINLSNELQPGFDLKQFGLPYTG